MKKLTNKWSLKTDFGLENFSSLQGENDDRTISGHKHHYKKSNFRGHCSHTG